MIKMIDEVKKRIENINNFSNDDERAHHAEDKLWYDVLSAIATGTVDKPELIAREALKTKKIYFACWYA